MDYVKILRSDGFDRDDYDLYTNNCIHFAEKLINFLLGRSLPEKQHKVLETLKPVGKALSSSSKLLSS